jgi:hypothetical protein
MGQGGWLEPGLGAALGAVVGAVVGAPDVAGSSDGDAAGTADGVACGDCASTALDPTPRTSSAAKSAQRTAFTRRRASADRVIASGVPGMAARDALHAHPAALDQSVSVDGLFRVTRAARLVPAARGQPEERRAIQVDQPDPDFLQLAPLSDVAAASTPADVISFASTTSSSACEAVAAGRRATSSTSQPGEMRWLKFLKIVRSRRRMRLRTTAPPILRPVDMPKRVRSRELRR